MTDREFIERRFGEIETKLDKLHVLIVGNGKVEGSLSYEVAQLKQFNRNVKRGVWAIVTGFLSAAGGLAWALFGKH